MEEKIKLHLGKMTTQELADWFGIKKSSLNSRLKKKLIELQLFCSFSKCYGGVIIKEIYLDEYIPFKEDNKIFLHLLLETEQNNFISSIAGMTRSYLQQHPECPYSFNTMYYRLTQAGNRLFGKYNKNNCSKGICGSRKKIWAVKTSDNNGYRYLTEEEQEIFNKHTRAFGSSEKGIKNLQNLAKQDVERDKEGALQALEENNKDFYSDVLVPTFAEIGYIISFTKKFMVIQF